LLEKRMLTTDWASLLQKAFLQNHKIASADGIRTVLAQTVEFRYNIVREKCSFEEASTDSVSVARINDVWVSLLARAAFYLASIFM